MHQIAHAEIHDDRTTLLFCETCREAHRPSDSDTAPDWDDQAEAHPQDDLRRFFSRHRSHPLRRLWRDGEAEVRSHARWDPLCAQTWQATDGHESFLVTLRRDALDAPKRIAVRRGLLRPEPPSIDVDGEAIAALFTEAIFPSTAPDEVRRGLVERLLATARSVGFDAFTPIDEDRRDPAVELACFPEELAAELLATLGSVLGSSELADSEKCFVEDLLGAVPVIRLKRTWTVLER